MQIRSEDLLERIQQDFPNEYQWARLNLLVELQAAEIERLNAAAQPSYDPAVPRPYVLEQHVGHGEESRHGG
jgi:hypothetical protein